MKIEGKDILEGFVKDKTLSFDEMYSLILEHDIGNIDNINDREIIEMYIKEKMEEGVMVSHMLQALENTSTHLFEIWLGNSMETPLPIVTKEDLRDALI